VNGECPSPHMRRRANRAAWGRIVARLSSIRRRLEMKIWKLVEAHHEKLGVGLFVMPCLLVPMIVMGVVYGLVLLFQ